MAIAPAAWGAIAAGIPLLGSLFGGDKTKKQTKQQKELMDYQWQRQDAQRPYGNATLDPKSNPVAATKMQQSNNNNLYNWGALSSMMTPQMKALLETVAPQYSAMQQSQLGAQVRPQGGTPAQQPGISRSMGQPSPAPGGMPGNGKYALPSQFGTASPGNLSSPYGSGGSMSGTGMSSKNNLSVPYGYGGSMPSTGTASPGNLSVPYGGGTQPQPPRQFMDKWAMLAGNGMPGGGIR